MIQRWHRHFNSLLNVESEFKEEMIQKVPEISPYLDLDGPPTEEELLKALNKMKKRKAGGKTGILPELILYGGAILWDRMLELMQSDGEVVRDWK